MQRESDGPSWVVQMEMPERANFVFWLRHRGGATGDWSDDVWETWVDEELGFGPAPTEEQSDRARHPTLASLAEREWPTFRREWGRVNGVKMTLARRLEPVQRQALVQQVMEGSAVDVELLFVDHAGDVARRVGRATWLLGEAYFEPGRLRSLLAEMRRTLEEGRPG